MVFSISLMLFLYFLYQNYNVNYYDEVGYINFAQQIESNGIWGIVSDLRTYLYPFIIYCFYEIAQNDLEKTKIFVSILQYTIYLATVVFVSKIFTTNSSNRKNIETIIISLGILNPYLIQGTTLFLTDILATCFAIIAVFLMLKSNYKNSMLKLFLAMLLIFMAIMIRPSSLIFLPVIVGIFLFKVFIGKCNHRMKLVYVFNYILISLIASLVMLPQLYMNITKFDDFTFLIHQDLYEAQSNWATKYLKYGTVIIEGEIPQLYYHTPLGIEETTMSKLLFDNPIAFTFIFIVHVFGLFDWGYVQTYIIDFYTSSRIYASIFLYLTWILIFWGIFKSKNTNKLETAIVISTAALYTIFMGTTAIESRFGYPIFLLLLPFVNFSLENLKINLKKVVVIMLIIILLFNISFWLDLQTHRINWFIL